MQFQQDFFTSALEDDRHKRQELTKHLKLETFSQNFMLPLFQTKCSTNNYHVLTTLSVKKKFELVLVG